MKASKCSLRKTGAGGEHPKLSLLCLMCIQIYSYIHASSNYPQDGLCKNRHATSHCHGKNKQKSHKIQQEEMTEGGITLPETNMK